jgi:hypothetical protein
MTFKTYSYNQPTAEPIPGVGGGNDIQMQPSCLRPGDWVTVSPCCGVDQVVAVLAHGITLQGTYSGPVSVQPLANLSGFWLQADIKRQPEISLGLVCATKNGALLDRPLPECAIGRRLRVSGRDLGIIISAAVLPDSRTMMYTDGLIEVKGVGSAFAGPDYCVAGPTGVGPTLTLAFDMPDDSAGTVAVLRGWKSTTSNLPPVIDFRKELWAV